METRLNQDTSVSLYSTWWIQVGREDDLVPALQKLAQDIMDQEEGTLMYLVHLPRYDFPEVPYGMSPIASEPKVRPGTLVFVEKYASWQAFKDHLSGPIFTNFVAQHAADFVPGEDGKPFVQVAFMDQIAGFSSK